MLDLLDLVKRYQVGSREPIYAVDGVSMSIARGELVVLYGPSGSGKTTLLEVIAGMLRPDSGTVLVDGRDLFEMSIGEADDYRLRQLGIISQSHNLISGASVVESALLKLRLTHDRKRSTPVVEELLTQLGLGDRLTHRIDELSMGERQRVVIARALANEPELVIADEPTGSLDTRQTRKVLRLLFRFCMERGVAMLLATHDPLAAGFADRVHELRDGRLEEYRPDDVLVALGSLRREV